MTAAALSGFPRADGCVGVRNRVLVLATVVCANAVVEALDRRGVPAALITHQHGCGQVGDDLALTRHVLIGVATSPNVGGVVLVSLGCESNQPDVLAQAVAASGRPVEVVSIQELGGVSAATEVAARHARVMRADLDRAARAPMGWPDLVVGLECGGSDGWSGVSANPALGRAADRLVELGATVVLAETPEIIGAEHLLAARAATPAVRDGLLRTVARWEDDVAGVGVDARGGQPAPGNIAGGITTIEEKSLGAIQKGGSTPLQQVVGYGERPTERGLVFMDTPGQDVEQLTGMAAGGCQVVCFTTGRGTPTGSPVLPVIKIATNSRVARLMAEHIDIDAGPVVTGEATLDEVAAQILSGVEAAVLGAPTAAERGGHREFAIPRRWGSL